jgi:flagella basal body P-ring formation protein FlgA
MIRMSRAPLLALALIALLVPVSGRADPAAVTLKPSIVVDGDVVRLGDLFDNVGDKAGFVIARAPKPGQKVMVDGDWLVHVAQMAGVTWTPSSPFFQTIVERSAQTISRDQIEQEVLKALAERGVSSDSKLDFSTRNPQMTIPGNVNPAIGLRDLSFDPQTKRFNVTVEVPAGAANATQLQVSGRVFRTIEVPVLAHSVDRGQLLSAHDFTFAHLREDTVRPDIELDLDQVIGMAAHRGLRSGESVSSADIERPVMVARGALVTLVLAQGGMTLTTQGRSIEQGAVGDVVRVTNTHSNLIVVGKVTGANLVTVAPEGGIALAN